MASWPAQTQNAKLKQQKRFKTVYEYDSMDQEDWENYLAKTKCLAEQIFLSNDDITNDKELNKQ